MAQLLVVVLLDAQTLISMIVSLCLKFGLFDFFGDNNYFDCCFRILG